MKKPEIPANEASRLEALHSLNILDTETEERFDRLTRLAKRLFSVPTALVSLVDENRQWFKSCVGLAAKETSRDVSFCGHAILEDDVFIISNATEDPRFADNPLVSDAPYIRFYAGCPLHLGEHKLGTLCIIDQKPRILDQDSINSLKDLASMAEHELAAVQMATMDQLTQLTNRRGFLLLAQHSLALCRRQGIPAALVYLDLDGFKAINDTYGHAEGDRALVAFSDQMKIAFRESDLCARLGGDEFVVLLSHATPAATEEAIDRFQRNLQEFNRNANRGYDIRFSSGTVAYDPEKHRSIDDLLQEGDALMYARKRGKSPAKTLLSP